MPPAVKAMVEFWKNTVAPLLGIPLALKLALNQMKLFCWMDVPLKFELIAVDAEAGQVDAAWATPTNFNPEPKTPGI